MAAHKKRILIDANPVVPYLALGRNSGIGRTCLELIKALDKIKTELPFEVELYTQNLKGVSARQLGTGFQTHHLYLRNDWFGKKISKLTCFRKLISRFDLQHITHNYEMDADPSKCIVTVHDAFFMKIDVNNFDNAEFRRTYPPFIRSARHIITCSEYSKKDIVETMGINEDKITVIPWGIDHNTFFAETDKPYIKCKLLEQYGLDRPFFLSVSCDAGRKRTPALIDAYKTLKNPQNDLVLVWSNPPSEILDKIADNNRIHILKNISNQSMRYLYNTATASINPTSYEGFGLPILEAMACGCLAVTCRNSSLPEVGGDIALYLEEPIQQSLPIVLHQLDQSEQDYSSIKNAGISRAAQFTWGRTAQLTAEVYASQLQV